jgi:hypothetical protein
MSLFPGRPDGDIDWEPLEDSHHIVYPVKHPAYTFVFARRGSCLVNLNDHRGCDEDVTMFRSVLMALALSAVVGSWCPVPGDADGTVTLSMEKIESLSHMLEE